MIPPRGKGGGGEEATCLGSEEQKFSRKAPGVTVKFSYAVANTG